MTILKYHEHMTDFEYDARAQLFNAKRTALTMLATLAINGTEYQTQALKAFIIELVSDQNTLAEFELQRADYDFTATRVAEYQFYDAAKQFAKAIIDADNDVS